MKKFKKTNTINLDKLVISKLTDTFIIHGGRYNPQCPRPSCDNGRCPSTGSQIVTELDC